MLNYHGIPMMCGHMCTCISYFDSEGSASNQIVQIL